MMTFSDEQRNALIQSAIQAKANAHVPYSRFQVGAALLDKHENASYGLCICAERTAYVKAVSEGVKEFLAIAVSCSQPDLFVTPCGACRQFMAEFGWDTKVICIRSSDQAVQCYTVRDLLPHGFSGSDLPK